MIESPWDVEVVRVKRKYKNLIKPEIVELVDESTGEVSVGTRSVVSTKFMDSTDFIKFYDWKVLRDLGRCGVGVLSYVMNILRYDGIVHINIDKCKKYLGYNNSRSVYNGLSELVGLDVLRKVKGMPASYYVNPNVLFRGDRSKVVPLSDER